MDYKKLLKGLTNKQFEDLCETWYSRLNKLKQYRIDNPDNLKVIPLIDEMIDRMMKLTPVYINYKQRLTPMPNFPKGGIEFMLNNIVNS